MPFKGRAQGLPHLPALELPADLKKDEEVYVVRATGEVFRDYDAYLARTGELRERSWACAWSGRQNLTYEEACESEAKAAKTVPKVPDELVGDCATLAHHSTLRFEELIGLLYDTAKSQGKLEVTAAKQTLSKASFKRWLLESMELHGRLWVVAPEVALPLGLPVEVPDHVKQELEQLAKDKGKSTAKPKGPAPGKENFQAGEAAAAAANGSKRKREAAKSIEEEEALLKPGTTKHAAFRVLQAYGRDEGLPVEEVLKLAIDNGIKTDWPSGAKRNLYHVLHTDPAFLRVGKNTYVLSVLFPDRPEWVEDAQKRDAERGAGKKQKVQGGAAGAGDAGEDVQPVQEGQPVKDDAETLARLERNVGHTQSLLVSYKTKLEVSEALVDAARKRLAEVEAMRSPSKAQASPGGRAGTRAGTAAGDTGGAAGAGPSDPTFELPPDLREYTGDPDDRKALMEWKRRQAAEQKKLDRARELWQSQERSRKQRNNMDAAKALEKEQKQMQSAQLELEKAKKAYEAAVRAAEEAQKALARERMRQELRGDKDRPRCNDKEERERRKALVMEAKRYPVDDLDLVDYLRKKAQEKGEPEPSGDVPVPEPLEEAAGQRLATTLYLADFLSQLGPSLGLPPINYVQLDQLLFGGGGALVAAAVAEAAPRVPGDDAAAEDGAGPSAPMTRGKKSKAKAQAKQADARRGSEGGASCPSVPDLYMALLRQLLKELKEAGALGRLEARWQQVLAPGTWPEVLRRYMLARAAAATSANGLVVGPEAALAVSALGSGDVESLTGREHVALLGFLADELMDMERLRGLFSARVEAAAGKAAELKADMAEDRKKLRELLEAEKEARKKKKEEVMAAAAVAAERAVREAIGGAGTVDGADGPAAKRPRLDDGTAADGDETEPTFELPPELVEYGGDPDDRKALMVWRQRQQAERQKLDKARAKWQAETQKRRKEEEAKRRAAIDEEKRNAREKKEAEEALLARQEELERELEKLIVRRLPLGCDRHYRRYWWGLAGLRSVVLVEDGEGRWATITQQQHIEALVAALDSRGIRELELKRNLQKVQAAVVAAMRKVQAVTAAAAAGAVAGEANGDAAGTSGGGASEEFDHEAIGSGQPRRSSRIEKLEAAAKQQAAPQRCRYASIQACVEVMGQLATGAETAKVPGPAEGWTAWLQQLLAAAAPCLKAAHAASSLTASRATSPDGAGPDGDAAAVAMAAQEAEEPDAHQLQQVYGQLRQRLLELQGWLLAHSGQEAADPSFAEQQQQQQEEQADEDDDDDEDEDGEDEDEDGDGGKEEREGTSEEDREMREGSEEGRPDQQLEKDGKANGDGSGTAVARAHKRLKRLSHGRSYHTHHALWLDDDSPEVLMLDKPKAAGGGNAGGGGPKDEKERAAAAAARHHMWRSRYELRSWSDAVAKACSAPRLAYCAATLLYHAAPLQLVEKAGRKSKK